MKKNNSIYYGNLYMAEYERFMNFLNNDDYKSVFKEDSWWTNVNYTEIVEQTNDYHQKLKDILHKAFDEGILDETKKYINEYRTFFGHEPLFYI